MARELVLDVNWLKDNNIRGVFQAGMGSDDSEIAIWNEAGIKNQIYIEPCKHHFNKCVGDVERHRCADANILCIEAALTNIVGRIKFYLNIYDSSHSTLPMLNIYDENGGILPIYKERPDVLKGMVSTEEIEVDADTIDNIFESSGLNPEDYNLLFLDTQNNEHLVLEGAKNSLKYFDFIEIEIATERIYEGSLVYDEWIPLMNKLGYQVIGTHYYYEKGIEVCKDVTFGKKSVLQK